MIGRARTTVAFIFLTTASGFCFGQEILGDTTAFPPGLLSKNGTNDPLILSDMSVSLTQFAVQKQVVGESQDTTVTTSVLNEAAVGLKVEIDIPELSGYQQILIELCPTDHPNQIVYKRNFTKGILISEGKVSNGKVTLILGEFLKDQSFKVTVTAEYSDKRTGPSTTKTIQL